MLLCAFLSTSAFSGQDGYINASASMDSRPVVILDAGHGGFDGGAVASDGTVEKNINLNIALITEELLEFNGFSVIMTRNSDTATEDNENAVVAARKRSDLKNRLSLMEKYPEAVYVSIHLNKYTTSAASGAQVFYSKNDSRSKRLGQSIQEAFVRLLQPDNKRAIKPGNSNVFLLQNATVPTVVAECGFLSNHRELELLKSEKYQRAVAFVLAEGITDYFEALK